MSLPSITAPAGTPVFRDQGHTVEEDSVYSQVAYTTGHSRARRIFTVPERVVTIKWFLSAAMLAAVERWYEVDLIAGERLFAARVANQGPGLLWWPARWIDFQTEMLTKNRGSLTGSIFLEGEGSEEGPDTGAIASEIGVALLDVRSSIVLPLALMSEISVALVQPLNLRSEILVPLRSAYSIDGGDFERIWIRMARTPVPGNEVDRANQEVLQRAWVRW